MSSRTRSLRRAMAPLALMALIFFLSAQSNLGTDLGLIDLIGRKIVHAGVYAAMTLLWWWAFLPLCGPEVRSMASRWALSAAALVSFLYAISDEFHQTFTDGRSGSPIDVGIDTVGIVFACWLVGSGWAERLLAEIERRVVARRRQNDL